MIVVLKHNVPEEKRNQLINWLRNQNIDVHPSLGEYQTVLGLVGDTSRIDMSLLESLDIVDSVKNLYRLDKTASCTPRQVGLGYIAGNDRL